MTALELVEAGVVFARVFGRMKVLAPKGRPDLIAALRFEVARRVPALREFAPNRSAPRGTCETCGDPLRSYCGGMCDLCVAARIKALTELGRIAA